MELVIGPEPEVGVAEAARRASVQAGIQLLPQATSGRGSWWRDGLADAVERGPVAPDAPTPYDAAPSPRRTRGATRA